MAIQRRFGPVKGAGVVVIERPTEETITASDLGTTAHVGVYERGEVGKLNFCPSAKAFARIMGGRIESSTAPDAAQDFFSHGRGAGELVAIRVTDGTEVTSYLDLFSRGWGTDPAIPQASTDNQAQKKTAVLRVKAKNGGRWGGRKRYLSGEVALVGDVGENTITTGLTMLANEWTGATLRLDGVTSKSYTVIGNTTAGVVSVEVDSTMATDLGAGSDPTNKGFALALATEVEDDGTRKAVAVRVRESELDPANEFGLDVYVDGQIVGKFNNLNMAPTSKRYAPSVVNKDAANAEVELVDLWGATGAIVPDVRPANFYGALKALTATKATFLPAQVVEAPAAAKVVAIDFPAQAAPYPHRLTLTWVDASNLYTVTATSLREKAVEIRNLPDFAVGAGEQLATVYTAPNINTIGITVDHSASPADGETIVIDVLPVDTSTVVGGEIAPSAKAAPLARYRIASATFESVTIESGDLTTAGSAPTRASVTGSVAQPFAVVAGNNDALAISVDGRKTIAVTLTAGAAQTAAQIAADINTAFDAAFGVGTLNPASVSADNKLVLTSPGGLDGYGPGSSITIGSPANNGNALLGLTAATTRGAAGTEAQLLFAEELSGGHNGGVPADQKFVDALAIGSSPLLKLAGRGKGVVMLACPGVTSTTVQKQGLQFAEATNHLFFVSVPADKTTEQSAIDYINDTIGRNDFGATFFPSFVSVADPDRDGMLKEVPTVGMIQGLIAGYARTFGGYHRPAAGIDAVLPRIVELPTGDEVLSGELLNPQGINLILKKKGNFVVWGARTISRSSAWQQITHRLQMSHYEHTFFEAFDFVIFALNNPETRETLKSTFHDFFRKEYAKGIFRGTYEEAVRVKIDNENNTAATEAAGDLYAEITLALVYFVERFIIGIGKAGIFENTSA